ncbi:putative DNA polymerase beta palm [Lyophyllum shimeji]|uniref:DNA-directed DNA polymerase n=1 Tax=Lyophyllum shimeji TaxID=47721 RepID=A0A9P3PYP9_LYOSH|nr:putative DNA polymerase beta palm [Lyophyllum shimeji]
MDMDVEAFFREQDKRMNLPDDDFDEYLNRIGAYRRKTGTETAAIHTKREGLAYRRERNDAHTNGPGVAVAVGALSEETRSVITGVQAPTSNNDAENCSRGLVDRAPSDRQDHNPFCTLSPPTNDRMKEDISCEVPPSHSTALGVVGTGLNEEHISPQARKRKPTVDEELDASQRKKKSTSPELSESRTSSKSPATAQSSRALEPARKPAPDEDPSDLFGQCEDEPSSCEYMPTPSPVKDSSPRLKRKASQDVGDSPHQKKRSGSPPVLHRTPSIEEITSFSASPGIDGKAVSQKAAPPRRMIKNKSGPKAGKVRKIATLDLRPVVPPAPDTAPDAGPPTSPIEDITLDPFMTNRALHAASSSLYLEIKQRVAQHASAKRRDKVMKIAPKSAKPGDTADDESASVIYVSSSSPQRGPSTVAVASTSANIVLKKKQPSSGKTDKEKTKAKAGKAKKKEKSVSMTPAEYALHLQSKVQAKRAAAAEKNPGEPAPPSQFLSGKTILYVGGDMLYASDTTRGRMDIIVKYGGALAPRYDASVVTHIVTDAPKRPTLRALGLKSLEEIPDHIPTVQWNWIVTAIGRPPDLTPEGLKVRMDATWQWAAFRERFDAGVEPPPPTGVNGNGKGKAKARAPEAVEFSRISEFTQDRPQVPDSEDEGHGGGDHPHKDKPAGAPLSPPTSPVRHANYASGASSTLAAAGPSKTEPEDPLADFYAKARAEHETEWARHGEVDESDDAASDWGAEEPRPAPAAEKRGWTCDNQEVQREACENQDVIDKLEELKKLHEAKQGDDDRWRVFSYSKCIRALRNHPKRIASFAEARAIRGVGDKTAAKVMEIIGTGNLRRIGYERTEDVAVTQLFRGVYGVGPSTAYQWYSAGCRTLKDVLAGKGGVKLCPAQKLGIRFYEDINQRMPREEAKEIFGLIKPIALDIDPKLFIEIMGSYRRGKNDCGDIDILITRPTDDGKTHQGVLSRLLQALHAEGILTEDLAVPEDPDGLEAIYRGLCRIPGRTGARRRRIDFLTVPWISRGAALLYYTGDDIFNRAIRMKANVLGYSLNQRGLFAGVVRDPNDRRVKLNSGTLIASETEAEIFKILEVPWQEPHQRIR